MYICLAKLFFYLSWAVFFFCQTNHMRSLIDFVEAQSCYFDQCNQHTQELLKQLTRFV